MIPTVLHVVLWSALAGLVLAHSARPLIRAQPRTIFGSPALRVAIVYQALVMSPAALYFYLAHPDWTWMYFVDPRRLPVATVTIVLIASAAVLLGGFWGGFVLLRASRFREMNAALGCAGLLLAFSLVLLRRRLLAYGTFDEWRAGTPLASIAEVKLGWALLISACAASVALAYAAYQLRLAGRRLA